MNLRPAVVLLLMAAAAATLHLRSSTDRTPPSEPLDLLSHHIDGMTGTDLPLDAEVLQVLGDGRFLNRVYTPERGSLGGQQIPVGLFIGYFPTQRTGQAIHSPQNCLPGSGWTFESANPTDIIGTNGKTYHVGSYVITDGTVRQEVLYWYRSHGRSISSDYVAKFYVIADAIRYDRTDGALIRVITPVEPNETRAESHKRAVQFAAALAPMLPPYIPD